MSSLIDLFPPKQGEGAIGYLRRLAVRNGYAGWKSLVGAAGITLSLNAVNRGKTALTQVLGLNSEWLEAVLPADNDGRGLHDPFYRRTLFDPVCPHCLHDDPFLRHAWEHCFVTACPTHGIHLIDHCPSCGEPLETSRPDIVYCSCGFDLRHTPVQPAPSLHLWMSARLSGDARPIDAIAELGKPDDYKDLAKLLFLLSVRADATKKVSPSKVAHPRSVAESIEFLAPLNRILADWPTSFHQHLGERFALGNQRVFNLSGRLGQWYLTLNAVCNKGLAFEPVWTAFSDAVVDHFDGSLRGQYSLRPSPGKNRRFISVTEAAAVLGCSHSTLNAAVRAKKVKGHETRFGATSSTWLVETAEVERLKKTRANWVSDDKAADILGVPAGVLVGLKRAGLLPYDGNWKHSIEKAGPIPIGALDELVTRVRSHLVETAEPNALPFSKLTGRRTTDATATRKLYRAIVEGEVRPVGHDREHGLGGFLFAERDVKRYLGAVALNDGLTLTQIEKVTGWKYESLSHWVYEGFLKSVVVDLQGRPARVVPLTDLLAFRRDWLPVSDIASALNSKSSAISRKLANCNVVVHGQKLLPDGAKRGGLVRLSDVAQLLFAPEGWSPS